MQSMSPVTASPWFAPCHDSFAWGPEIKSGGPVTECFACPTTAVSWSPSSSPAVWRGSTGSSRMRLFEVTSVKKRIPKDFWARAFKSPTLEDCEIERPALRPLVRAAVTWSMAQIALNTAMCSDQSWANAHNSLLYSAYLSNWLTVV